jgi:predicted metalloprotease with PDZ domain
MVFTPTPGSVLGSSFCSTAGSLCLAKIRPNSLFSGAVLNEGDKVIAINKLPCEHMGPSEAVAVTQKDSESVAILVRRHRANVVVLSHQAGTGEECRDAQDAALYNDARSLYGAAFLVIIVVVCFVLFSNF